MWSLISQYRLNSGKFWEKGRPGTTKKKSILLYAIFAKF